VRAEIGRPAHRPEVPRHDGQPASTLETGGECRPAISSFRVVRVVRGCFGIVHRQAGTMQQENHRWTQMDTDSGAKGAFAPADPGHRPLTLLVVSALSDRMAA